MDGLSRRELLSVAAAAGAGLLLGRMGVGQEQSARGEDVEIALVGAGEQGRHLMADCLKIPGVRFRAVCDIWPYHQTYSSNVLKRHGQPVNVYEDYRQMLQKERTLTAVIVATPDWMHAEQAIGCLKAGKHVYCEKAMAPNPADAAAMVRAARETGRLLQIGTHRRSSPMYQHARKLIQEDKILGRVTNAYAQWNRPLRAEVSWAKQPGRSGIPARHFVIRRERVLALRRDPNHEENCTRQDSNL